MAVGLECEHTLNVTARMGKINFSPSNFKDLRVAKGARSTTLALGASRRPLSRIGRNRCFEGFKSLVGPQQFRSVF
jgi:hypothetical protein